MIKSTPWDAAVFGIPTWELTEYSESALQLAVQTTGHYTIKVDPLANKELLSTYGFYYCDTLIEPVCDAGRLRIFRHADATISRDVVAAEVLPICHSAFANGRFHRDFNLAQDKADHRYDQWLLQLLETQQVYGLFWQGTLAGFIGYVENGLVLHAVAKGHRGRGLSKYWWSMVCSDLIESGHTKVKSSISAANVPVLNLYASLGFSFVNPKDIYHCLAGPR